MTATFYDSLCLSYHSHWDPVRPSGLVNNDEHMGRGRDKLGRGIPEQPIDGRQEMGERN